MNFVILKSANKHCILILGTKNELFKAWRQKSNFMESLGKFTDRFNTLPEKKKEKRNLYICKDKVWLQTGL